ncbi:ATP synthase F1 subunit delta [Sulfurihydrogenibium subterraneum]|uniref:ATP synthase F1 subunit delta n=1 Tax=Sulfurihydrogenibium subterraneum TaxID=171121 RepID=UPI000491DB38|nr:ATP synthase F1 subunit delta [Sulfurihydrogenibium subterraneum]
MKVDKKFLKNIVKKIIKVLGNDEEKLSNTSKALDVLSLFYKSNSNFRNLVLSPTVSLEEKEKAILKVLTTLNLPEEVKSLILLSIRENKGNIIKELNKAFKFEVEKFFATVQGEVITAHPIDESLLNGIKASLESKIGKKIEFTVKEDKSLIGGAVIKAGSYILDTSVRNYLKQLERTLTRF